jgi:hypothetical protein
MIFPLHFDACLWCCCTRFVPKFGCLLVAKALRFV